MTKYQKVFCDIFYSSVRVIGGYLRPVSICVIFIFGKIDQASVRLTALHERCMLGIALIFIEHKLSQPVLRVIFFYVREPALGIIFIYHGEIRAGPVISDLS